MPNKDPKRASQAGRRNVMAIDGCSDIGPAQAFRPRALEVQQNLVSLRIAKRVAEDKRCGLFGVAPESKCCFKVRKLDDPACSEFARLVEQRIDKGQSDDLRLRAGNNGTKQTGSAGGQDGIDFLPARSCIFVEYEFSFGDVIATWFLFTRAFNRFL